MRTHNILASKAQSSRLVGQAAAGESFDIAEAGKPPVKVVPVDSPKIQRRIGFMEGEIALPDDFDAMDAEIARLFGAIDCSWRKAQTR